MKRYELYSTCTDKYQKCTQCSLTMLQQHPMVQDPASSSSFTFSPDFPCTGTIHPRFYCHAKFSTCKISLAITNICWLCSFACHVLYKVVHVTKLSFSQYSLFFLLFIIITLFQCLINKCRHFNGFINIK